MKAEKYQISELIFDKQSIKKISAGPYYTILFILSGNCCFYEGSIRHRCGFEEMILMRPGARVELERTNASMELRLICVRYSPELLAELSDETTSLEAGLTTVPYTCASVHCESEILMLCKNLAHRLLNLTDTKITPAKTGGSNTNGAKTADASAEQIRNDYAGQIFEKSILSMLIVLILRACIHAEFRQQTGRRTLLLDNLFAYIHSHLSEELTLDDLEKHFFVSKYHILREFKRATGQTLHRYIVKNRLELCQKYIAEGLPITEVYRLGGFGGYNHFFRAFKQEYGMTPKEYYCTTLPLSP